ncbi:MAG: hypothetical protein AB8G15_13005 [Saprospiraceae bacterium]
MSSNLSNKLKHLIALGKLEKAIVLYFEKMQDVNATLLSFRYHSLKKSFTTGLISTEAFAVKANNLVLTLLSHLEMKDRALSLVGAKKKNYTEYI